LIADWVRLREALDAVWENLAVAMLGCNLCVSSRHVQDEQDFTEGALKGGDTNNKKWRLKFIL